MEQNISEPVGNLPHPSEDFRKMPKPSESFRTVPNASERFRNLPKASERKESHTLTVREVARMFENAGVARTERSIINWCQPNGTGVARLDAYLDPNEGKYFITPQSAETAIKEEQAKFAKNLPPSETFRNESHVSEPSRKPHSAPSEDDGEVVAELRKENMDLKIANRGKDYFIEQLQKERESLASERKDYVEKLMTFNRKVGELETRLLQLEAPPHQSGHLPPYAEQDIPNTEK